MRDSILILLAKSVRMFAFGSIATVLFLHLEAIGLSTEQIGFLFGAALVGDLLITLPLTTHADRWGRKKVLVISALLKVLAGAFLLTSQNFFILLLAVTIGVISPAGGEIGPFAPVEQASLTQETNEQPELIAKFYSYYNFVGYFAQAGGALVAGFVVGSSSNKESGYMTVIFVYSCLGLLLLCMYLLLSKNIEVNITPPKDEAKETEMMPLKKGEENAGVGDETSKKEVVDVESNSKDSQGSSKREEKSGIVKMIGLKSWNSLKVVATLSGLFVIDSFAGGLVMQSLIVAWFAKRYEVDPEWLGGMLAGMNVLSGLSSLLVVPIVKRIGPLNTAVFTHIPSNVLLLLVPLMPSATTSLLMILARSSLSQMDVPARQAFVAISVDPDERSAAGGITGLIRSLGVVLSSFVWPPMMAASSTSMMFALPFIISGALKTFYDILLFFCFRGFQKN